MKDFLLFGDQFFTTQAEPWVIYSIWKLIHGYPVYDWPQKQWFSLSLYNWLLYYFNAAACLLVGADRMQIAIVGRVITLFFALAGAALTYRITILAIKDQGLKPRFLIIVAGIGLLWFSPGAIGELGYATRGDVPADVLALEAFSLFMASLPGGYLPLILSAVMFFLGWSFKQSVIGIFTVCLAYSWFVFDLRRAFIFSATFFLPVVIVVIMGGPIYRYNIFQAPSISPITLGNILEFLPRAIVYALFIFGWLAYLPILAGELPNLLAGRNSLRRWPLASQRLILLLAAGCFTFFMGIVMIGKEGSRGNMFFEAFITLTILGLISIHHLLGPKKRNPAFWLFYGAVIMFISAVLPLKNLLLFKQGNMGIIPLISQSDYQSKVEFGEWIKSLPTPLFINDPFFSFPWYSNHGNYPGIFVDPVFYYRAQAKGLLEGGGLKSLLKQGYFGALILSPGDELLPIVSQYGYRQIEIPSKYIYYQGTTLSHKSGPISLWVRSNSNLIH